MKSYLTIFWLYKRISKAIVIYFPKFKFAMKTIDAWNWSWFQLSQLIKSENTWTREQIQVFKESLLDYDL
jgi:hypothetical protein